MERVKTLVKKLNEQLDNNTAPTALLETVKMLQAELLHLQNKQFSDDEGFATVYIPDIYGGRRQPATKVEPVAKITTDEELNQDNTTEQPKEEIADEVIENNTPAEEEKTFEVLQIDEAEIEAELEEIKRNAEEKNNMAAKAKPILVFEDDEKQDVLEQYRTAQHPPHYQPKHAMHDTLSGNLFADTESLNDKLRAEKKELSDVLGEEPIKDLKKAISINDRAVYINELFKGDETAYERSIKTLNHFTIYPEAEYFIKRELKLRLQWDDSNPLVQQFDHLIKRRFSHR